MGTVFNQESIQNVQFDILANISHDVRTPIHTIMGMIDLAIEEADNPEAVKRYLNKIKNAGRQLNNQVNRLLDITRIERNIVELHMEPCTAMDIYEMADLLFHLYVGDRRLNIEIHVEDMTKSTFLADRAKIEHILGNLISNAVNYTLDGGTITFTGETLLGTEREIINRYTLTDTGIGMEDKLGEQMFQPDSNAEGTKFGLYTVKKLVDIMHGSIRLTSAAMQGTTVVFELAGTISDIEEKKEVIHEEEDVSILRGRRILLCEDNSLNVEMTRQFMENAGIIVDCACNGQEAVNQIENTEPYYYDAVLMDIRMPVMDGIEATRQIRKMNREDTYVLPIVALTASAYDEDYKKSLAAGMDAHLTKPFSINALLQKLTGFWRVYKEQV